MSNVLTIGPEAGALLDFACVTAAIADGHSLPKATIGDTFLRRAGDTLLTRSAMIDGLGSLVKCATVFPENPARGLPMVNGAVNLFADETGAFEALIDFALVTWWKTAADSLLAASRLAPPQVDTILVVGAGTVAESLVRAYRSLWPEADYLIWNRTQDKAAPLAARHGLTIVPDLEAAVRRADIVTCATLSPVPLIRGDWLRPGQHIDLIGAFRPDLREADDTAIRRARLFVDSFETTLDHIGELKIPLETGVIDRHDVLADFYDLAAFRRDPDDITLFKNGGGAHLDLMVARCILERVREA